MPPKIEVKKLNVFYGDFQALHDVGLHIKANRITAFIGPSGCGKTTLLKTLDRMNDLVDGTRIGLINAFGVAAMAIGLALNQRRAIATTSASDGTFGCGVNREHVIAIDNHSGDAVARRSVGHVGNRNAFVGGNVDCPFVVFTNVDHGQFPLGGDVQRFMKRPRV